MRNSISAPNQHFHITIIFDLTCSRVGYCDYATKWTLFGSRSGKNTFLSTKRPDRPKDPPRPLFNWRRRLVPRG